MTPSEIRAREQAARREYPLAKACFDEARAAAIENLLNSKPTETEKREELYRLVQIIDKVSNGLLALCGQGSEEIQAYVDSLTTKATTRNR